MMISSQTGNRIKTNGLLHRGPRSNVMPYYSSERNNPYSSNDALDLNNDELIFTFIDQSASSLSERELNKSSEQINLNNCVSNEKKSSCYKSSKQLNSTPAEESIFEMAAFQLAHLRSFSKSVRNLNLVSESKKDHVPSEDRLKKKLDHENVILELLECERKRLEIKLNEIDSRDEGESLENQLEIIDAKVAEQKNNIENLEFQMLEDQISFEENNRNNNRSDAKPNPSDAVSDEKRNSIDLFLQYEKMVKDPLIYENDELERNRTRINIDKSFKIDQIHNGKVQASTKPTKATTKVPIMTINHQDYEKDCLPIEEVRKEFHTFILDEVDKKMPENYHYVSYQKINSNSAESSLTSTPNHKSWPLKKISGHLSTNIDDEKSKECEESSDSMFSSNETSIENQKNQSNPFEDFERISNTKNALDGNNNNTSLELVDYQNRNVDSYYESQMNQVISDSDMNIQSQEELNVNRQCLVGGISSVPLREKFPHSNLPPHYNISIYENQKLYGSEQEEMVISSNFKSLIDYGYVHERPPKTDVKRAVSAMNTPCQNRRNFQNKDLAMDLSSMKQKKNTDRSRPLTRYLPDPDNEGIDLRKYLVSMCSYDLNSSLLRSSITVERERCFGYLYKMVGKSSQSYFNESSSIENAGSSLFLSAKRRALSFLQKPWKKRWFLLDRKRRIITYYDNQIDLKSGLSSIKPKAMISFADIVNVVPDIDSGPNSCVFTMILLSNYASNCTSTINFKLKAPNQECMKVWQDTLFLCAGAYKNFKKGCN